MPIGGAKETPHRRGTGCQGRPEASGKGEEESYDLIVPVKVENREDRDPLEERSEQVDVTV